MKETKTIKRELLEWGILLAIPIILYLSGWHTPVMGKMQELLLTTGIMQPEMALPEDQQLAADYNFPLLTASGEKASLADFRDKTIFLNFWASWCPPCIAEMPNIHNLYEKTTSEDVVFLMVSLDNEYEAARRFFINKNYQFPLYFINDRIPAVFATSTIPTTFVISPEGKIVARHKGMAQYDTDTFHQFLLNL